MAIVFQFQRKFRVKESRRLKDFILQLIEKESKKLNKLVYVFCDDTYLLDLNQQYLNRDYYTDIISFNMNSIDNHIIDGEIYISIDRVLDNSNSFLEPFHKELHRVIFHGVLHLCGYDDRTVVQKKEMTSKENYYLDMFHVEHS